MNKEDLEKLRDKLNSLISEKSDYSEILKVSQELDDYIIKFTARAIESSCGGSVVAKE